MIRAKKTKFVLLPKHLKLVLVGINILVLIVVNFLIYRFVFPYFGVPDKIISGWNPLRGDATFSMRTFMMLFLNILIFVVLYLSLRPVFVRINKRQKPGHS